MAIYIQSDMVLEDILYVEDSKNTSHILSQVENAKNNMRNVIDGANFGAKYIIEESGEVRYSCSAGKNPEKAIKRGFSTTY